MRVPLSWLSDYVDISLAPEELAARLTLLGMEVSSVERWGAEWQSVVVGELLTVTKHPRADRLSLTTVSVGSGEPLEIVCGATNIAPGQRVPVALPGAVLPGGRRIERTEKMGVVSNGMLCSGDELHLTADAEGILILPPDAPIGRELTQLYGDVVLDVDVKPNRGDALSLIGLAREVAAATGAAIRWPQTDPPEQGQPTTKCLEVRVDAPQLCTRFVGRWIDNVSIAPSPERVQMRLLAAGMRPVSNVVDASNYVMLELGKPIHTFDAAAVARGTSGPAHLVVRTAQRGERLVTLDHVERTLDPETLVIADDSRALAIAGVMGGADTEVSDATRSVIVESAIFDPVTIRRTAQRYALRSEASLRFEKGQEFRLARIGADRCARLIAEWAGGSVAQGIVDTNPSEPEPPTVAFRPARVNRLLGTDLGANQQRELLARVGIETAPATDKATITVALDPQPITTTVGGDDALVATVPTWRRDLAIEADIAEEVARLHGYEAVPAHLPDTTMPSYRPSPLEVRDAIRETLVGAGLTETVTYALVSPRGVETFALSRPVPSVGGDAEPGGDPIVVTNPLSRDHSVLRQGLIGSLVEVAADNLRRGATSVAAFEVGKGYGRRGGDAREWWRLGFVLTGNADEPSFDRAARPFELDDAKGVIELLARRLDAPAVVYEPERDERIFHPGRSARVSAGDAVAGVVGQLHPQLLDELDLKASGVIVADVSVAGLSGGQLPAVRAAAPARYPAVERDLAVVVRADVPAAAVAGVIRTAAGSLLERLTLFDIYRGVPLAADEKSLAHRLTFQAPDRTLTEAEVDAAVEAVTDALRKDLGGRLRT